MHTFNFNNMQKILLTIFFLCIMAWESALADGQGNNSGEIEIVLNGTTTNKGMKPRAPSRQSIYCYYDGSSLYFSFAYSEGDCDLTVSSASGIQFYTFSSDAPESVFIGAVSGASITILTEAGNTYVGEIE